MKSNIVYYNAGWLSLRQVLMKKRMLMTKTKKKKNDVEKEKSNLDEINVTFFFFHFEPETIETFIWTKPSLQSKARQNHLALGHQRNMLWCPKWNPIYILSCKWVPTPTLVTRPSYTCCVAFKPWYSSSNPVALSKITFGWSWTERVTCRKVPWSLYHKCFYLQDSNSVGLSRETNYFWLSSVGLHHTWTLCNLSSN